MERDEDPELSKPVRFNLSDVFPGYEIDLQEVTLSANQWIEDSKRLRFRQESLEFFDEPVSRNVTKSTEVDLDITLQPMEIKTFVMSMYAKV